MAAISVEQIAEEMRHLPPEKLVEVRDFVGYLRQRVSPHVEGVELAEVGMADYLAGLEDYEDRLARGEIRWE
jgi:hypothetical protein